MFTGPFSHWAEKIEEEEREKRRKKNENKR